MRVFKCIIYAILIVASIAFVGLGIRAVITLAWSVNADKTKALIYEVEEEGENTNLVYIMYEVNDNRFDRHNFEIPSNYSKDFIEIYYSKDDIGDIKIVNEVYIAFGEFIFVLLWLLIMLFVFTDMKRIFRIRL